MGRPRKEWTEADAEQFKKLCAIFCTRKECASIMGVDVRTLDNLIAETFPDTPTWPEAFDRYSSNGRATLRRKMFELAMDGDKAAIIFMAKNYLGMSDNGLTDDKPVAERPATGAVAKIVDRSRFANRMTSNG